MKTQVSLLKKALVILAGFTLSSGLVAGSPESWRYESHHPTGANLHAVWAASGNDVFAGGDGGVILRWDGVQWETMDTPTQKSVFSIHGTSATDVWAVGGDNYRTDQADRSLVLHFDGSVWSEVTPPDYFGTTYVLESVYAVSASEVWAVTATGTFPVYWNGVSWQFFTGIPGGMEGGLYAVTGAGTDLFFSGTHGQIMNRSGGVWTLERKTETGFFSVNLMQTIHAFDTGNVYAGDNYGELYKRNPADGTWSEFGIAQSGNTRGLWLRSATEIYMVGSDHVRLSDGTGSDPEKVSFEGEMRGNWVAAHGSGGVLFGVGALGTVHEIKLDDPGRWALSPLSVGGGSPITKPLNRTTRFTGVSPYGAQGGFALYGDTQFRPDARALFVYDGSGFHPAFESPVPGQPDAVPPGMANDTWVRAALFAGGPLVAWSNPTSPYAAGVHRKKLFSWEEVTDRFGNSLRAVRAFWQAPADTDPDNFVVYAIDTVRLYRIALPRSVFPGPSPEFEMVYSLPTPLWSTTGFNCLWGRSPSEIYMGTSDGRIFAYNGSGASEEATPAGSDPVLFVCGDDHAAGDVYAAGENGLAWHRGSAGTWQALAGVEQRTNDHFTGLAPSPDGDSVYATQTTDYSIIGGGLGRIWNFDGAVASLEVRGLAGSPGFLVRTEDVAGGRRDLYAVSSTGTIVTTKPLPSGYSLARAGVGTGWSPLGTGGVEIRLPAGSPPVPSIPMIATWTGSEDLPAFLTSVIDTDTDGVVPINTKRFTIKQDESETGATAMPPVEIRLPVDEDEFFRRISPGSGTLLRNEGEGWSPVEARVDVETMTISPVSAGGFSTWAVGFRPEIKIEALPAGQIKLSWDEPAEAFVLEQSNDLGASDPWTETGATPVLNDHRWEVTIPGAGAVRFYRLRTPLE